ncbi:MAG: class II aldolase/adducin family protein [Alphaproteobacteria bacterium]
MARPKHQKLRRDIIDTCLEMNASGINQGTSGNVSVRIADGMLITPTTIPYNKMTPAQIIPVGFDGSYDGDIEPSSEWRMHLDIYKARPEAQAVIHAHPTFSIALACLRKKIPAFHYMIAAAGGTDIRCAKYATFGTQELSDYMLAALKDRKACLLGTHGMICFGSSLESGLWLAVEVEALARQYWHACQVGKPYILTAAEMQPVLEAFGAGYAKRPGKAKAA